MERMATRAAEVAAVEAAVAQLPPLVAERFENSKASHRFMSFIGKELILYKLDEEKKPHSVVRLTCQDATLAGNDGMASVWKADTGTTFKVTHIPNEIAPGVFMWMTFMSDVQFSYYKGQPSVRFSMLYSCQKHPMTKVSGCYFLQERAPYDMEYNK